MELITTLAQYWNEFLLAGLGFLVIGLINLGISMWLIASDHNILGMSVGLISSIFCLATRCSIAIGIVLGIIKLVLNIS